MADCSSVPVALAVPPAASPSRPSPAVVSECVDLTRCDSDNKLIYLFSGPVGLAGGFDQCIRDLGRDVVCFDLEVPLGHDMCDDVFFAIDADDLPVCFQVQTVADKQRSLWQPVSDEEALGFASTPAEGPSLCFCFFE